MAQDIARLYQQCDLARPLQPGDPRYIPFEGLRGEGDLMAQLTNALRWSDVPLQVLFAGHRGGGKSTELLRLQHALAQPPAGEDRYFVVYFEADSEDVDVNDVDFPDLLFAIIRQVGKALRERVHEDFRPAWLSRFVDDLKRFLGSEVDFEKLQLDAKIAKITATIKSSPDARVDIRKALEPNVSNLIVAANDLLDEAVTRLRLKGYRDLILIVDNLDRIVLRDLPDSPFNTHEHLFINRGAQLAQLRCHVVYTLPLTRRFAEQAVRGMSNDFERALNRPEFFEVLRQIDRSHALPGSDYDQLLLYNLSVLEYLNGAAWYAVNPAVRVLEKLQPPRRARVRRS